MSRENRFALCGLALVMLLAPALTFHPVGGHLLAAGMGNLPGEFTHGRVIALIVLTLTSAAPFAGFIYTVGRGAWAGSRTSSLARASAPGTRSHLTYRVVESELILVVTAGVLRPRTFVSTAAEREMTAASLHAALLHEESHRRRHDVFWRLMLRGVGSAFIGVASVRRAIDTAMLRDECAADEYAIRCGARRSDLFDAIVAAAGEPASLASAGLGDGSVDFRLARLAYPEIPVPAGSPQNLVVLAGVVALPALTAHFLSLVFAAWSSHLMA